MKKIFVCATCIVLHLVTYAQDFNLPKNRIPVKYPDFMAYVLTYDGKIKTTSLANERTYYWLKAKQIHSSKGGYEGDLLHGEYTSLYRNDALKEKGTYTKGLKTGEWKEWHINGELKLVSHYKKGSASGVFTYYNEAGKVIRKELYKNGRMHGRQHVYNDTAEVVTKYNRGKLVTPKVNVKKRKDHHTTQSMEKNKKNSKIARDGDGTQPAGLEGLPGDKKETGKKKKEKVARDRKRKWFNKKVKTENLEEKKPADEKTNKKNNLNKKDDREIKQG
jgi:hypothetical protein